MGRPKSTKPQKAAQAINTPFVSFWTSTPFWGAIGLLAGAFITPFTLTYVVIAVWAIIVFEFWRAISTAKLISRTLATIIFACTLLFLIYQLRRIFPKPEVPRTLDQQAAILAAELTKKLPGLQAQAARARFQFDGISSPRTSGLNGHEKWLVQGVPFAVDITYTAVGDYTADRFAAIRDMWLVPSYDASAIQAKAIELLSAENRAQGIVQSRSSFFFSAALDGSLTAKQLANIRSGQDHVLLMWALLWQDSAGEHHVYECRVMQTPYSTDEYEEPIWRSCGVFQESK